MKLDIDTLADWLDAKPRHRETLATFLADADERVSYEPGERVEDMGEGWYMCEDCADAVEASPGVTSCTSCGRVLVTQAFVWASTTREAELRAVPGGVPDLRFRIAEQVFQKSDDGWTRSGVRASFEDIARALRGDAADGVDMEALFEAYSLREDDGYYVCDDFDVWVQAADAASLQSVCRLIRDGFTFLPGGSWVPSWMFGDRRMGSPLQLLEPVLERLSQLSNEAHNAACAELLRYVACDEDVFVHDALAMSQNVADDITHSLAALEVHELEPHSSNLVESVCQLCRSAAGFEYGVNALPLALKCLSLPLTDEQSAWVVDAIDAFAGKQAAELLEQNPFETYSELIPRDSVASLVESINRLVDAHPGLRATLEYAEQHQSAPQ